MCRSWKGVKKTAGCDPLLFTSFRLRRSFRQSRFRSRFLSGLFRFCFRCLYRFLCATRFLCSFFFLFGRGLGGFLFLLFLFLRNGNDQFHQRYGSRISRTPPQLDDSGITTCGVSKAFLSLFEKLENDILFADNRQHLPLGVQISAFGKGNQAIGPPFDFLCLDIRGADAIIFEKRCDHVSKHGASVAGGPTQFQSGFTVSHTVVYSLLSGPSVGGIKPSSFIPRERPISDRTSLISFKDFRPKFLVLSISCSVF